MTWNHNEITSEWDDQDLRVDIRVDIRVGRSGHQSGAITLLSNLLKMAFEARD